MQASGKPREVQTVIAIRMLENLCTEAGAQAGCETVGWFAVFAHQCSSMLQKVILLAEISTWTFFTCFKILLHFVESHAFRVQTQESWNLRLPSPPLQLVVPLVDLAMSTRVTQVLHLVAVVHHFAAVWAVLPSFWLQLQRLQALPQVFQDSSMFHTPTPHSRCAS